MPRSSPPTQKQIASRLGISQTLVSRALSGRAGEIGAAPATVDRILRAAAEWNYQPNTSALALLGAPTRTIGVVVKNFEDPYFGRLIGEIQRLARENRYSLLLTGGSNEDQAALQKHRVDGIILAGSDFPDPLRLLARSGVPVVQIGTGPQLPQSVQIFMNEEHGIAELVGHLVEWGHRDIGFVAKAVPANLRRGDILRRTLRERGLAVRKDWFCECEAHEIGAAEAAVSGLRHIKRLPSAFVAAEDDIAIALISALARAGGRVPQHFSVVGIDDIPASGLMIPALTTLRQPVTEMAAAAITALIEEAKPPRRISMQGKLILRGSCAPAPALPVPFPSSTPRGNIRPTVKQAPRHRNYL